METADERRCTPMRKQDQHTSGEAGYTPWHITTGTREHGGVPYRSREGRELAERVVLSVGHSTHSLEALVELLRKHDIGVLVDVRSIPRSRRVPHFSRETLAGAVRDAGIRYLYLGRELGGRPLGAEFYDEAGNVLYERIAAQPSFAHAIDRLEREIPAARVALLCAEANPANCHRRLLIGPALAHRGIDLHHIRADGLLVTEEALSQMGGRRQKSGKDLDGSASPEQPKQLHLFEIRRRGYGAEPAVSLWTIGFTARTAAEFFIALRDAGIRRVIDVRLNNTSQLSGFTKRRDLPFFLRELCDAAYEHQPLLAPTQELLTAYRENGDWDRYAAAFGALLAERGVEGLLERAHFTVPTALLCSERSATRCHRSLVAQYLRERWGTVEVIDL